MLPDPKNPAWCWDVLFFKMAFGGALSVGAPLFVLAAAANLVTGFYSYAPEPHWFMTVTGFLLDLGAGLVAGLLLGSALFPAWFGFRRWNSAQEFLKLSKLADPLSDHDRWLRPAWSAIGASALGQAVMAFFVYHAVTALATLIAWPPAPWVAPWVGRFPLYWAYSVGGIAMLRVLLPIGYGLWFNLGIRRLGQTIIRERLEQVRVEQQANFRIREAQERITRRPLICRPTAPGTGPEGPAPWSIHRASDQGILDDAALGSPSAELPSVVKPPVVGQRQKPSPESITSRPWAAF